MKRSRIALAAALGVVVAIAGFAPGTSAATKRTTTKPKPTQPAPTTIQAPATTPAYKPKADAPTLKIGTIPDQDPAKLQRQFGLVASYLNAKTGLKVEYVPVTDYTSAVTGYRVGDLDAVFFGGLTGVQAAKQVPGSVFLAQRDIDAVFRSVFIANKDFDGGPYKETKQLAGIVGESFTFGSEVSTSGRLMPQYFLFEAGVKLNDFRGQPGFSGSHDRTIRLVEAGTYTIGVLNKAVWDTAVKNKTVNTDKVRVIYETPTYFDYHWLGRPDLDKRFGDGTAAALKSSLLSMSSSVPAEAELLKLFSAGSFIETKPENYAQIAKTGTRMGLL
jgi:phosphonate transport system substrate-binding protein